MRLSRVFCAFNLSNAFTRINGSVVRVESIWIFFKSFQREICSSQINLWKVKHSYWLVYLKTWWAFLKMETAKLWLKFKKLSSVNIIYILCPILVISSEKHILSEEKGKTRLQKSQWWRIMFLTYLAFSVKKWFFQGTWVVTFHFPMLYFYQMRLEKKSGSMIKMKIKVTTMDFRKNAR